MVSRLLILPCHTLAFSISTSFFCNFTNFYEVCNTLKNLLSQSKSTKNLVFYRLVRHVVYSNTCLTSLMCYWSLSLVIVSRKWPLKLGSLKYAYGKNMETNCFCDLVL